MNCAMQVYPRGMGHCWRFLTKCAPLEKEMAKPLQYSCFENPMNTVKRQKDMMLEDKPPQVSRSPICYWRMAEKELQKRLGQNGNVAQLWMCLEVKVKSDTVKTNIA